MRLDQYVAQYWPEYSRSVWQKHIAAGHVRVNGSVITSTKYELDEDDEVTTHIPEEPDYSASELPVVYEDDHVLVLNKPAGVLTHAKGEIAEEFTVADFVRMRMTEKDTSNRPGIVHRLDRETTGAIVVAKNDAAHRGLAEQFEGDYAMKYHLAPPILSRIDQRTGKPATFIETDLVDPRYFSAANIKNRLESYFQMIKQKRTAGVH